MIRVQLVAAAIFIIAACFIVREAIPAALIFLPAILLALAEDVANSRRRNHNRKSRNHK